MLLAFISEAFLSFCSLSFSAMCSPAHNFSHTVGSRCLEFEGKLISCAFLCEQQKHFYNGWRYVMMIMLGVGARTPKSRNQNERERGKRTESTRDWLGIRMRSVKHINFLSEGRVGKCEMWGRYARGGCLSLSKAEKNLIYCYHVVMCVYRTFWMLSFSYYRRLMFLFPSQLRKRKGKLFYSTMIYFVVLCCCLNGELSRVTKCLEYLFTVIKEYYNID